MIDLTNESFARWLRSQRPDMRMFFERSDEEQETMAMAGDAYVADLIVALAHAIRDPEVAAASLFGEEADEEDIAVRRAAQMAAERITMGGVSERREQIKEQRVQERDITRTMLGRHPDSVRS